MSTLSKKQFETLTGIAYDQGYARGLEEGFNKGAISLAEDFEEIFNQLKNHPDSKDFLENIKIVEEEFKILLKKLPKNKYNKPEEY